VELAADSVGERVRSSPGRHRRARPPRLAGPSDQALHWLAGRYAIALRVGGAVLFTAVAVLAATREVSGWWLSAPLTGLCLWSAFFTWRVLRSGLTTTVVLADAAAISALALAQQHLVPAVLISDNTTWMLPLACTSVYILQIALRPWLGLSAAAIVVVAYGLGAGAVADGWLLGVETIVAAGLVAVIRGGARQADSIVAAGLETERRIRAEEARRADEREQHRQLHDTVLSTLTMVAAGAFAGPSRALAAQADRDLRVLQGLAAAPPPLPGSPLPGSPLPGSPLPGTPLPGSPLPGTPLPGTPLPGSPVPGAPVPGAPVPGAPVPGAAPVPGTAVAGAAPVPGTAVPSWPTPLTDLSQKLELVAASTDDLAVRLKLVPATLPSPVADQLVACVGEALRNVERHAGTGQAEVTVTGGAGWAVVEVTDRGRGFDPAATPPSRRGIRESITGRIVAAGGRAAIDSRPGAGTTVTVSWPA
jgi:signal transduction histidine kinase